MQEKTTGLGIGKTPPALDIDTGESRLPERKDSEDTNLSNVPPEREERLPGKTEEEPVPREERLPGKDERLTV